MYPDLQDIKIAMPKLPGSPEPETVWPDAVFAFYFLEKARGRCYSDGRHRFIAASELKKIAEHFIGHEISSYAFVTALKLARVTTRPHVINPAELAKLEVKFLPLDKFEEARQLWVAYMATLVKDIADERTELARIAAIKEKFSATGLSSSAI